MFIWTLLIPLGVSSVLFLYGAATQLTARYGLEYGEGIVLWQAAHVTPLTGAYHPIDRFPYVVFHYPPLFHVASRAMGGVAGDLLLGGRLVTFGSALLIMGTLGAIVYRAQSGADPFVRWSSALAAALLPTALPNVREWVPAMRVDIFGLMLALISLWVFIEGRSRPRLRYVAFAGFVAALFAKQTLVAAPLAALVVSTWESPREGVKLAAFAGVLGLMLLVAMQLATNGQFAVHLFVHNQNSYDINRAVNGWWSNLRDAAPVLALAVTALVFGFRAGSRITIRTLSVYALVACAVSWTSGKFGSATNYFLEINLIACVLGGLAVAKAAEQWRRSPTWAAAAVASLVVLAAATRVPTMAVETLQLTPEARALAAARTNEARWAQDLLRRTPGPVFSWDLMSLVLAGKDVPLEPAIMFELSRAGKWDITPFLDQIRAGYYSIIVVNSFAEWLPSEAVSQAMQIRYVPAEQFGGYHLYRPVSR